MFDFAQSLLYANKLKFENGEFTILDQKCCVTLADTTIKMQKKIIETLNEKGKDLLYNASKEEGFELTKEFSKIQKSKTELEQFIIKFLMLSGWGEFEIFKKSKLGIIYINKNSPFPERYGKSKEPICILMRGFLAGVYSYLTENNYECFEEKCRAQGNNFCIFKIMPKNKQQKNDDTI
jgi:predicted hydrocarbon binding protein